MMVLELLQGIADGVKELEDVRIFNLEVELLEKGKSVLVTDLPTVLDYLANNIYWNEESNWMHADEAKVRSI